MFPYLLNLTLYIFLESVRGDARGQSLLCGVDAGKMPVSRSWGHHGPKF